MDCLKSFSIHTASNSTFSGAQVKTWLSGVETFFQCEPSLDSTFTIQGFKNINIFGVDVIGFVNSIPSAPTAGAIVEDWTIRLRINGQIPFVSGEVVAAPNDWGIVTSGNPARTFAIGKYNNSLKFASPFQSVASIQLLQLISQGYGAQTAGNINLSWNLNFVFYYNYEGE